MASSPYVIKTDGGSRGNPGPSGIGFVIERDGVQVMVGGAFIGVTTNNVAEYSALIWALENVLTLRPESVEIYADSELMVKQLTGLYKVKSKDLQPLFFTVQRLLSEIGDYSVGHIYREDNSVADGLANEAMDAKSTVGNPAIGIDGPLESAPATTGSLFDIEEYAKESPSMASTQIGTYVLTIKDHFDAAHNLYGYEGECRLLHGHTWDVEVSVSSPHLDDIGIVYDFKSLKADLKQVLAAYDHVYLNEVEPFNEMSPTAENLARVICDQLQGIVDPSVCVDEVAVWESPIARVAYRPS